MSAPGEVATWWGAVEHVAPVPGVDPVLVTEGHVTLVIEIAGLLAEYGYRLPAHDGRYTAMSRMTTIVRQLVDTYEGRS